MPLSKIQNGGLPLSKEQAEKVLQLLDKKQELEAKRPKHIELPAPLQNLHKQCKSCKEITNKKLIAGQCPACYHREYRMLKSGKIKPGDLEGKTGGITETDLWNMSLIKFLKLQIQPKLHDTLLRERLSREREGTISKDKEEKEKEVLLNYIRLRDGSLVPLAAYLEANNADDVSL